jgi:hypothetical protein
VPADVSGAGCSGRRRASGPVAVGACSGKFQNICRWGVYPVERGAETPYDSSIIVPVGEGQGQWVACIF